jgi:hypothetical protein
MSMTSTDSNGDTPQCGQRQLNETVLHVDRIEVHDDHHGVAAVGRPLRVGKDLGVVGLVKRETPVVLQGRMIAADAIDSPDHLGEAAACR